MGFSRKKRRFAAIVIGVSTGGVKALKYLASNLDSTFPLPIVVVTHIAAEADDGLSVLLNAQKGIAVKECDEGDPLVAGEMFVAPANYHTLIEKRGIISLSVDPPVNFARPSVDVLFESAADVYRDKLIAVILTGAGYDGSRGLKKIKDFGGFTIVQEPEDAEMPSMPLEAIKLSPPDAVINLEMLPHLLKTLAEERQP